MTATATPDRHGGCGAPATRIVFRGLIKRLWLCAECEYKGKGAAKAYETLPPGQEPKQDGIYRGVARKCGEETST